MIRHREHEADFLKWARQFSGELFVMLAVYADETGTHGLKPGGKEPAPGVYGYIATPEYWARFRERWQSVLEKYKAPYFHFRELNPSERKKPGNPYYKWDEERVDDFIHDMAIVASHKAVPFGGYASVKAIQGGPASSYLPTYKAAFDAFFVDFDTTMQNHFPRYKGKVSFFFDQNENEEWIGILNTAIKSAVERNPQIGEWSFVNSKTGNGTPCQATDLFAFRNRQNAETIYESDRFGSMRLLDLILARNGFQPSHLLGTLKTLSHQEWAKLVNKMRAEGKLFSATGEKFYPIRHSASLKALLRPGISVKYVQKRV